MAEVRFAHAALADLDAIDDYGIERFGEEVAERYMRGFEDAFALLARHPRAGRTQPELGRAFRCLLHREHRILYQYTADIVLIVRIVHQAQHIGRQTMKGIE